jgi:acetyl-CoA acetyltransferase
MRDDAICIVGVGESDDIGNTPNRSGLALQAQAAKSALADAGLKKSEIDGLMTQTGGRMPPVTFAEYFGLQARFVDCTFIGSIQCCLIRACRRCYSCRHLPPYRSYGTTPRQGEYVSLAPEYPDDFERPYGICFPVGLYALSARRHMHQYGTRREQFAKLVVESRRWASLNPRATRRDPVTIAAVMASPPVVSPIHRLDAFC